MTLTDQGQGRERRRFHLDVARVLAVLSSGALFGGASLLGAAVLFDGDPARAAGSAAAAAAPAYTLDNSAKTFSIKDVEKTAAGYQYWFFDKAFAEGRTIKLSVVGPRQRSHPPHQHEGHEFFFVLSGKAEFFLDGKTRVVGPQTALYCPPGVMHGIANAGDTELQYLVIKDYPWPAQPEAAAAKP